MNRKLTLIFFPVFCLVIFLFSRCAHDKKEIISPNSVPDWLQQQIDSSCYPDEVAKIFITKCAVAGCHNTQSKDGAAGLDLTSWDKLFNGSRGGAAVIAADVDNSFLLHFINTYSDLGPIKAPSMPYNQTPLSREEVTTVINWVKDGAPDCKGHRFTDSSPSRKKIYITNQGCDLVSVWDADRQVIMKYVSVGGDNHLIEYTHKVGISP